MFRKSGPRRAGGPGHRRQKALTPTVGSQAQNKALQQGSLADEEHFAGILKSILRSLDDAKAEEIVTIPLAGKTTIADEMVIASGRSNVHVGAIAERVIKACKDAGVTPRVEGRPACDWVLVDAGDVIVHLFRPEVRQFYNLEKMWGGDRPVERLAAARRSA